MRRTTLWGGLSLSIGHDFALEIHGPRLRSRKGADAILSRSRSVANSRRPCAVTENENITTLATARFTLRESGLARRCILMQAARDDLGCGSRALAKAVIGDASTAGMLLRNRDRDEEWGMVVMLTGQSTGQELRVIHNAEWMVNCGAVCAAARVGMRGWKLRPDHRIGAHEERHLVWLLPTTATSRA